MIYVGYGPQDRQVSVASLHALLSAAASGAAGAIRNCTDNTFATKTSYAGVPDDDVVGAADRAAQAVCEQMRKEYFPWAGMIAEEDNLRIACTLPGKDAHFAYFTADGLDGTKRYLAGHRNGIGTMVAFVWDGKVAGAVVADVFGGHKYTLSDDRVIWERPMGAPMQLTELSRGLHVQDGCILTRGNLAEYDPLTARLVASWPEEQRFHRRRLSIGLSMAELWRDNAVVHVQGPNFNTPWDDTPHGAISQALGMVWLRPTAEGRALQEFTPGLYTTVERRDYCVVMVHRSRLDDLRQLVPIRALAH